MLTNANSLSFSENCRSEVQITQGPGLIWIQYNFRHDGGPSLKYAMSIDIPPDYGSSEKYQGTLGHKVNHNFKFNSIFTPIETARLV